MAIDVLKGIMGEAELLYMSDEAILNLGKLLDDQLAKRLQNYLDNPDAFDDTKNRVQSLIGDKIKMALFHEVVKERGLIEIVSRLNLDTLPYADIDIDQTVEELTWLKENKKYLKASIVPRRKEDFESFLRSVSSLNIPDNIPHYSNLIKRIKANSEMFYSRYERNRATRMGVLIAMSDTWEIALEGLKYLRYCRQKGLVGYLPKEF